MTLNLKTSFRSGNRRMALKTYKEDKSKNGKKPVRDSSDYTRQRRVGVFVRALNK